MDLWASEASLLDQVRAGKSWATPDGREPEAWDAVAPSGDDPAVRIRGSLLAKILLGRFKQCKHNVRGVHIAGYWIEGGLDLSHVHSLSADQGRAAALLVAWGCRFDGIIDYSFSRVSGVIVQASTLGGFIARGADIDIGMSLVGCLLDPAFATVASSAPLRRGSDGATRTLPAVRLDLDGCRLGGDLDLSGLRLPHDTSPQGAEVEIDADNALVRGSVKLNAECSSQISAGMDGRLPALYANFDNADIFGDFIADGARFVAPCKQSRRDPAECLDLRGATVRGDVSLKYIHTLGRVRFEDADIAQDLDLGGACLVEPRGVAFEAQALVVHGSVHLVDRQGAARGGEPPADPRLLAYGQLRFARARVDGDLDGSGATVCAVDVSIEGVAIDLRSAEFGGSVYLDARRDVGPGFFVGLINMLQIRVRGSIVFAGSWFRAPCGQMMAPRRIDAELYSEKEMLHELEERGISHRTLRGRKFTVADIYYGYQNGFWQVDDGWPVWPRGAHEEKVTESAGNGGPRKTPEPNLAVALLEALGIYPALAYRPEDLWRLRGGCRAIALEDARVDGAVLFGTSIDIYPEAGKDAENNGEPAAPGGEILDHPANGPSVVVGCADLDRIRIDGELRLTGGIFRAVTPVLHGVGGDPETDPDAARPTDEGPDPSLSYPSTVGWTELMGRTCLSLRGAVIGGRLDSRFFGAVSVKRRPKQAFDREHFAKLRAHLNLVPERGAHWIWHAQGAPSSNGDRRVPDPIVSLPVPTPKADSSALPKCHQDPCGYAEEMLYMLKHLAIEEQRQDRSLGATRPDVPPVQEWADGYNLRPDGRFDLRDAYVNAIHDHPCHGWPTSDGHLQLNGCKYDFLALEPDESRLHPPDNGAPETGHLEPDDPEPGAPETGEATDERLFTALRDRERFGQSRIARGWDTVRSLAREGGLWSIERLFRYGLLLRLLLWRGRPSGDDRSVVGSPAWFRHQHFSRCMAKRAERYRRYARRSFRRRNDARCRPADRRIAWLEQQYHGADPTPKDFLPQPYERLCCVMRANGYREDADSVAAAKRRQRSRATLLNTITWFGETFLRLTSNYGYSPVRVVFVAFLAIASGAAALEVAKDHRLLVFESLQTESVAVWNAVQESDDEASEDLILDTWLLAIDGFIPLVEVGYASEWSVAEWRSVGQDDRQIAQLPAGADGLPDWPGAVESFMAIDFCKATEDATSVAACIGAILGEVARLPFAILAWVIGFVFALVQCLFSWGGTGLGITDIRAVWSDLPPENTLRWLGAIYHGLGWALISMAIVTFTGVIRRD